MTDHFDIRLLTGRQVSSSLLADVAQLAEVYGGGYLHLGEQLTIPSIPITTLAEVGKRLRERSITFSVLPSEIFQDGAGI